jgi:hypothetical protein
MSDNVLAAAGKGLGRTTPDFDLHECHPERLVRLVTLA